MAIELGLRALLLAQSPITALCPPQTIRGITYDGIFNEHPVEGFLPPFVLVAQMSFDPLLHLGSTGGLADTEFDIDCYSRSYPGAMALADQVQDFLEDYTGPAGDDDTIKAVLLQGRRYDKVIEGQGADQRQHVISVSFQIQHA